MNLYEVVTKLNPLISNPFAQHQDARRPFGYSMLEYQIMRNGEGEAPELGQVGHFPKPSMFDSIASESNRVARKKKMKDSMQSEADRNRHMQAHQQIIQPGGASPFNGCAADNEHEAEFVLQPLAPDGELAQPLGACALAEIEEVGVIHHATRIRILVKYADGEVKGVVTGEGVHGHRTININCYFSRYVLAYCTIDNNSLNYSYDLLGA